MSSFFFSNVWVFFLKNYFSGEKYEVFSKNIMFSNFRYRILRKLYFKQSVFLNYSELFLEIYPEKLQKKPKYLNFIHNRFSNVNLSLKDTETGRIIALSKTILRPSLVKPFINIIISSRKY